MRISLRKLATAWRLWMHLGPREFWTEVRARTKWYRGQASRNTRLLQKARSTPPASTLSISVVVPILNPGVDLERLLLSLHSQRGCQLDIILLDSGSTEFDRQVIASYPGVRRVEVPRAEFSHSGTRNLGVQLCLHPLVLLTVQDAHLPHDTWLYQLVALFQAKRVAALSVGESPRLDADAYARFAIEMQNQTTGLRGNTIVYQKLAGSRRDRIRAASLHNVACLYSRDVLLRHPFAGAFAEDLTLGLELLGERVRIGNTAELRIVHSHTRPAFYWLKRQFVARRYFRSVGLAEADSCWSQTVFLQFLHAFVLASGGSDWNSAFLWLSRQDSDLVAWLDALGVSGYSNASPSDTLTDLVAEVRAFMPSTGQESSVFLLKALAAKAGWILGGANLESWPEDLREKVEGLASSI